MKWVFFILLFVVATQSLKLQAVAPSRIDIIVEKNVYPRVTKLVRCTERGCGQLTNFTVRENVIEIAENVVTTKTLGNTNFTVYIDVYRPDGTKLGSTRLTAKIDGHPQVETNFPDNNAVYLWISLGVAVVGIVVVTTVAISVEHQRKKKKGGRVISEYVFNGEGLTTSAYEKENDKLAKELGHLIY